MYPVLYTYNPEDASGRHGDWVNGRKSCCAYSSLIKSKLPNFELVKLKGVIELFEPYGNTSSISYRNQTNTNIIIDSRTRSPTPKLPSI